ncbi:hypothetical protein G7054_g1413 [Neopestalotiopsis clavispora]|nr:hypothetical protein G7054_g1413 [Neopestalotiopsis clavispora]
MEDLREAVVLPAIPAALVPAAPVLAAARAIPATPIALGDIIQVIGQDRRVPRANRFRVLPNIPVLRRRMAGQMQRVINGPAAGRIRANVQVMSMQYMGNLTNLIIHRLRLHATESMLVVVILAMSLQMRQMGSTPADVVATLS